MGGIGSTRWEGQPRRQIVENCYVITPAMFQTELANIGNTERYLELVGKWFGFAEGGIFAECVALPPMGLGLRLSYQRQIIGSLYEDIEQLIPLVSVPRYMGGVQHYFLCPECDQRCFKLYLPIKGTVHLCRQCHELTYKSCRDSHQFDRGFFLQYPCFDRKFRLEKLITRFETVKSKRAIKRAEMAFDQMLRQGVI